MYKRDVAILLLSCVAILVSLQNEGTFTFEKAWFHYTHSEVDDLYAKHHELPPPVVADLNGDGHLEVIVTTPDLKLQVVPPKPSGLRGEGFAQTVPLTEVSLLYKRVLVAAGRRPVALAVGYIDALPKDFVEPLRKQVIVVVTATWQVLCFDHNLKLLWEHDAKARFPHHSHIKEVAVYISPHQVQSADRGLVVVGASVERGDLASGEGLESVRTKEGDVRFFDDDDVLLAQLREEAEEHHHEKSAGMVDALSDLDADDPLAGLPGSRHFSYLALEGGRGEVRWHHGAEDFHKDLEALEEQLQPQHNYRLDAEKLEGRHFGEASCRDYRESVLHVLPHVWDRPTDTRLEEAHFVKHREGKGAAKRELAEHSGKTPGLKGGATAPPMVQHGLLGSLFGGSGSATRRARLAPNVAAAAGGRGGVHAHLAEGTHSGGRGGKSGAHSAHARTGHDPHGAHNVSANALVAYLEDGIEVLHLFTGRTICKLHLPSRTLHADMDGDGVLDHISVYHGHAQEGDDEDGAVPGELHAVSARGHRVARHCTATAMSGIPPRDQLWQAYVCGPRKFGSLARGKNVFKRASAGQAPTELATPVMLPVPDLGSGYRSHKRLHGVIVFLTNKGQMSAFNSKGSPLWTIFLPISWPAAEENPDHVASTLQAMALYRHAVPTAVLAAGDTHAVVVSEHGNVLDTLELPAPPLQPLVVMDFNGDGLNDIILVTDRGLYGYVQVQHLGGGLSLSALLLALVVAMAIVYYTQHYEVTGTQKRAQKLRSTDFVD